jgi:LysR family transcriptional regulator, chromosome initiation inhibitor
MRNLDPASLECLPALVEEGSFEAAARRLSVTQSAVSQRLAALEAEVGTVLIVRGRPLQATLAGQRLLRHAKQFRLKHADLMAELRALAPALGRGSGDEERLAIALDADSVATWAVPALSEMQRMQMPVEIIAGHRDFTHERMVAGEVVGCVGTREQPLRGCRTTRLGTMSYRVVAQRAFAAQRCPEGLLERSTGELPFVDADRKQDSLTRSVITTAGLENADVRRLIVPGPEVQLRAVLAGWGVGMLPELLVRESLANGELVDVAPDCRPSVDLFLHSWILESDVLIQLTQALQKGARRMLGTQNTGTASKQCRELETEYG